MSRPRPDTNAVRPRQSLERLNDQIEDLREDLRRLESLVRRAVDDSGSWGSVKKAAMTLNVGEDKIRHACIRAYLDRPDARRIDVTILDSVTARWISGPPENKRWRFKLWLPDCKPRPPA